MKTLNILTDVELKQIFGPLEDILPLHEGINTVTFKIIRQVYVILFFSKLLFQR